MAVLAPGVLANLITNPPIIPTNASATVTSTVTTATTGDPLIGGDLGVEPQEGDEDDEQQEQEEQEKEEQQQQPQARGEGFKFADSLYLPDLG